MIFFNTNFFDPKNNSRLGMYFFVHAALIYPHGSDIKQPILERGALLRKLETQGFGAMLPAALKLPSCDVKRLSKCDEMRDIRNGFPVICCK